MSEGVCESVFEGVWEERGSESVNENVWAERWPEPEPVHKREGEGRVRRVERGGEGEGEGRAKRYLRRGLVA